MIFKIHRHPQPPYIASSGTLITLRAPEIFHRTRSPAAKTLGGDTAAINPTISECERALNALTLQPTPYDPDYVEGLYSDYTCSDDDVYPEAKGKIGNSVSS
jgi:hypothetical protein